MNIPRFCPPLPPPIGTVVHVSTVAALVAAVNNAAAGTTILLADGTYALDGEYLRFDTPELTLRSASGNREAVVLDGNYLTTEIIQIVASGVTIADLTLREAYYHPIHVMSTPGSHTLNTMIYNVHIIDPGEQAVKINPYALRGRLFYGQRHGGLFPHRADRYRKAAHPQQLLHRGHRRPSVPGLDHSGQPDRRVLVQRRAFRARRPFLGHLPGHSGRTKPAAQQRPRGRFRSAGQPKRAAPTAPTGTTPARAPGAAMWTITAD